MDIFATFEFCEPFSEIFSSSPVCIQHDLWIETFKFMVRFQRELRVCSGVSQRPCLSGTQVPLLESGLPGVHKQISELQPHSIEECFFHVQNDRFVLRTYPKFLPKVVSSFTLNKTIELPMFFPTLDFCSGTSHT